MDEPKRLIKLGAYLGEGPLWSVKEQALYFVDILNSRLFRYRPEAENLESFDTTVPVGCLGLRKAGGLVMATRQGFAFWDEYQKTPRFIINPEAHKADARFNDGAVDPGGRFWAGTAAPGHTSSLYRLDADLSVHTMATGISISNGIGWSPDRHTMYYTDTLKRVIYAYDYNVQDGSIENRRIFVQLGKDEPGVPDGLAVDCQGFVWSARWGGWKVSRFDPQGRLELDIPMPVEQPSSLAFGGRDLDELFITSAWETMSQEKRQAQPMAGDVFWMKADVKGMPVYEFAG